MNWKTPKAFYKNLDAEFHFDFDPCPSEGSQKAVFDGLAIPWKKCNFVNPPYGREITKWVQKGIAEHALGKTVVFLVAARTDTKWWHDLMDRASEIRFIKGRLKFEGYPGGSAPFPSAIVVLKGGK